MKTTMNRKQCDLLLKFHKLCQDLKCRLSGNIVTFFFFSVSQVKPEICRLNKVVHGLSGKSDRCPAISGEKFFNIRRKLLK